MNYEQFKKDVHALYLGGHIAQSMAVWLMGLKPAKRWLAVKAHLAIQFFIKKALEEVTRESKK